MMCGSRLCGRTTDIETGQQVGYTTLPHLSSFAIAGPFEVSGQEIPPVAERSSFAGRRRLTRKLPCARKISINAGAARLSATG